MSNVKSFRLFLVVIVVAALAISIYYIYRHYYLISKIATVTAEIPTNLKVNEKATLPIVIDTKTETINAAEIYLKFDPSKIKVDSVSKDNSFFQLWIDEPKFSNEAGEISFAGGLPTPGFSGRGTIGNVEIVALKSGWQKITFNPRTRALKNDGLGTAIQLNLAPIEFKVK